MANGIVTGERLTMFVVGKMKTPRCFITGHNQKVGCCKNYLRSASKKLTESFNFQKRKVAFVIETALPTQACNLSWVKLIFLAPNTNSITQPIYHEVIRSPKTKYCCLEQREEDA